MTYSSKRRTLLLAAATAPLVLTVTACASAQTAAPDEAGADRVASGGS
ncbi:PenA family class A beta-lactamase, partial [Burkholderia pyrrocinia]|nr:PenA family class A beta-lactamase [Burkholderia pyrrocinia]